MEASKFVALGSFANRTIIVTGGAGSIGYPLSIAFARAGVNAVVNDLGGNAEGGGCLHAGC
jgi:NAD(P)-dependent dehydrogenase (short-subunit alcohol dehydrogenase family)